MANNYLTPNQQLAAYLPTSVVVTAGAGTGKTHMLAERYLYYLKEKNLSPLEIVAVTFTEKAAKELRSRIRILISQQLPQRTDILAELEAATISTIHALASRICEEHPSVAGIPADFTVIDDLEGKIWLDEALESALIRLPPQVYQLIPFSLMSKVMSGLWTDPYTATKALQQGIQDGNTLIRYARREGLKKLVNDSIWTKTWSILSQYQGQVGDKLEIIRQDTLVAMTELEDEENVDNAIAFLTGIKLSVGSKKSWQDDGFRVVKEALTSLRELVKKTIQTGLITLTLTEADEQLKQLLPALTEAYQDITNYLGKLKWQARLLTFSDLEIYALKALRDLQVQKYYRQRWQVFLVDEFQDTNPTQAELLQTLTKTAQLTIVGDVKQSIYGFRRADLRVFKQFKQKILNNNGREVILSQSFRTHQPLLKQINQIFAPLLGDLHQELRSDRFLEAEEKRGEEEKYIQVFAVEKHPDSSKSQRLRVEAYHLAQKIKQMLAEKIPVYDKQTQQLRPIQPRDIAILTRTWSPLQYYEEALAAAGIPVAPSGGGNLLVTREAKDTWALLRFLVEPQDNIALIAVLRSPFFAISDRILFQLGISKESKIDWWETIASASLPELEHPVKVLSQLLQLRYQEAPSRLIQIADRLTGYTAVIANLSGAARRMADWQGFRELITELEQGTNDLFGVVRRLKRLYDSESEIARPALDVGNAVSLMTIFAAKGLEWSVVAIADLSRERPNISQPIYFDSYWGVVWQWELAGETQTPALYTYLKFLQQQREEQEALRVLYVALTRARDYLFLSATEPDQGDLSRLKPGLDVANLQIETVSFTGEAALPPLPPVQTFHVTSLPPLLIDSVGSGIFELPVTALSEFNRCPLRFQYRFLEGHPGIGEGIAYASQVGTLVHKALEYDIFEVEKLMAFADPSWSQAAAAEAIALASRFWQHPQYQSFYTTAIAKEAKITLQIQQITFTGVIDLVGENWILDYKSDRDINPQDHRFQLWAYAQALKSQQAHIAYLRHDYVHSFSQTKLTAITEEIESLVKKINAGNYIANSSSANCQICPYCAFCDFAHLD
ncbi:UvrD/REP helicase [Stanieria cyanosphaera PCC 7437]|uniref:DNA 3'-5' helicase n=1 Tax=Stanieria cyanosphaera (strain ATCC 29371 / PCC 7437) TaxID=111780 RepID=K9Y099_STAC7|nr:UvrD-helicase domain-containing protein [Stanieria cyanosphaera]AFZ37811.1 UvrD/REP helicase [Stanieria cyanosphaera PCC 7437]